MKLIALYKNLFVRSAWARTITWIVIVLFAAGIFKLVDTNVNRKPEIESIDPMIGLPGDTLHIRGAFFGEQRKNSFVEIAGSKITSSGYLTWNDREISLKLPANIQDGLVFVCTSAGKSEPAFFANENGIPVAVHADPSTSVPSIASIEPSSASIGQIISIYGTNFGTSRGASRIYFTANREETLTAHNDQNGASLPQNSAFIEASQQNFDYESWTDTEIKVRIPDGADSGSIYIETDKGISGTKKITVNFNAGKKLYQSKRTFVVQTTADIANHIATQESTISLFMPKPVISSFQPFVELNDIYPDPFIVDDPYDIIHKKQLNKIVNNRQKFSQTYVVTAYTIKNSIKPSSIGQYRDKTSPIYLNYTSADALIPSREDSVKLLLQTIIGKEKNPYNQAKLIYNFFIENYKIREKSHDGDSSVLDLIRKKRGDAYDFAILYTALLRAANIPCIPVAGVLVHNKNKAEPHWWTEIYFENYGWFPVDTALGCGLNFEAFIKVEDPQDYYFGSLDNQHITYSRSWRQLRQSADNSKIVYRPRTYALQSIWEEAGDATSSYSSLWNDPVILGIY